MGVMCENYIIADNNMSYVHSLLHLVLLTVVFAIVETFENQFLLTL